MSVDREALSSLRIEREEPASEKSRKWVWLVVAALAIALVVFLMFSMRSTATVVEVAPVEWGGGEGSGGGTVLNANGYVVARRQATISSEVSGRVTSIRVEEGMAVEQGDLLATIDPGNSGVALDLARAQVRAASSSLDETSVRLAEARLERNRAARLAEQGVGSDQELDRAQAELDALQARLARQRADVEVARRQVAVQQENVDDTRILAPFGGVVISKNAQEGEMISPNSAGGGFTRTGICTIVDMNSLEIEVDVNEAYINRVSPEQRVEALLDAYSDFAIPAHVITVVPAADRQKATVRVRIAIDVSDPRILPDMGVKVSFLSDERIESERFVKVPAAAVRQDDGRDVVYLVEGSTASRRAVSVQGQQDGEVRISAGLQVGDRVVVSAESELTDGSEIRIKEGTDE